MPEGSALARPAVSAPPGGRDVRPRGRRRLALAAIGVIVLAIIAVATLRPSVPSTPVAVPAKAAASLTVTVIPVSLHRMADTLMVTGTLVPWEDLSVGTEAAGLTVTQVLVEEGDHVAAGQLLAKLDDAVILAQLKQKQAQINRA
jgi:multidrug efflux pump subunit AcrA (membrane-fusion protein)